MSLINHYDIGYNKEKLNVINKLLKTTERNIN